MKLTSQPDGNGGLSIHIDGDLTIYEAAEARASLLALIDGVRSVELDLADVGDIDSAGLQLLLATARTLGGCLTLVHASGAVVEAIGLLGLGPRLPIARAA
ncbi:STAS domain-containing protein [Massilia sp. CFBP9012]|uniref:STAS domain-containing protein n=1 Tax=Massilia sp. CFBP9012 TaxID=3096531 RepID=UPI002A6B79C7|nr:STAS domain-containing protein [Massilia sp. CFBP9012]MDY0975966.1 STAS domain-containing protein [Massilia sp. CFBP9012]